MKKNQLKSHHSFSSLQGSELASSSYSKYTINHISHFHKTIISIVLQQQVSPLSLDGQKYLVAFSHLIIRLLQEPHMSYHVIDSLKSKNLLHSIQIPHSKLLTPTSIPSLRQILNWMADVVHREDITMETLLDDYYSRFPFATMEQLIDVELFNHTIVQEQIELPAKKKRPRRQVLKHLYSSRKNLHRKFQR
jgi:hypothetical protein